MRLQHIALLTLALLAACAAPPVAPPDAGLGTGTPAAASSPSETAPAVTPDQAAPAASTPFGAIERQAVLPAPLYVLDRGQVARIERDGVTRAQVTRERIDIEGYPPITSFDARPDGAIAYVVGDLESDRLSRADGRGGEPQVLYSEQGHELSDVVWSPDGSQIYLRLLNNKEPPDIPAGVYRVAAEGGPLELVQADDPVDDPVNPARGVSGYRPFAFSPDGATLLVEAFSLFYEDCALATIPVGGGPPARIALPEGAQTYCGEAAWAPDGSVLFLAGPPADRPGVGPTVWRAVPGGADVAELGGPDLLARAPVGLPGGAVRFFHVELPADPAAPATFTPAEIDAARQARDLADPFSDRLALALWAPDGAGAVVALESQQDGLILRWLPLGGEPLDLPSTGDSIRGLRWAAE